MPSIELNIEDLRLPGHAPTSPPRRAAPRPGTSEKFLKGPIPFDWLTSAARAAAGGAVLKLVLLLWFQAGLKKSAEVTVPGTLLRSWKLSRYAYYRALAKLEEAKLISVDRNVGKGKKPIVTLLDYRVEDEA